MSKEAIEYIKHIRNEYAIYYFRKPAFIKK